RLDDAKADRVIAIGGDAVEMIHERVAELLHLGQSLPAQRLQPPEKKPRHTVSGRVGPQPIQLFAQYIRLEQPAIGRKQSLQLDPLRPAHHLPPTQKSNHRLPRPNARMTAPARKNSCRRTSSRA